MSFLPLNGTFSPIFTRVSFRFTFQIMSRQDQFWKTKIVVVKFLSWPSPCTVETGFFITLFRGRNSVHVQAKLVTNSCQISVKKWSSFGCIFAVEMADKTPQFLSTMYRHFEVRYRQKCQPGKSAEKMQVSSCF